MAIFNSYVKLPEGIVDLGLTYFVRKGIYSTHV